MFRFWSTKCIFWHTVNRKHAKECNFILYKIIMILYHFIVRLQSRNIIWVYRIVNMKNIKKNCTFTFIILIRVVVQVMVRYYQCRTYMYLYTKYIITKEFISHIAFMSSFFSFSLPVFNSPRAQRLKRPKCHKYELSFSPH